MSNINNLDKLKLIYMQSNKLKKKYLGSVFFMVNVMKKIQSMEKKMMMVLGNT